MVWNSIFVSGQGKNYKLVERKLSMADMAYCVKCKEKREIKDAHQVTMKNGRAALQGQCPVCGTKLNRILPSSAIKK